MTDNIEDFYNRWTKAYDVFSSNPVVNEWREEAISSLDLDDGSTVVDIGCGTGANVPFLSREVGSEGKVICVDLASDPLDMIMDRKRNGEFDNVECVRADATRMPLSDADAYFASFSIGMLPRTVKTVKKWCKNMNRGSKICLLDVVKSESDTGILNKPLQVFTGMTVPTDMQNKIELSVSGEALDQLDSEVRQVHEYLDQNHNIISRDRKFGGCVAWVSSEIQ